MKTEQSSRVSADYPDGSPGRWPDGTRRSWGNGFTHGFDNRPHGYVTGTGARRGAKPQANPRPPNAFGGTNGQIPGMGPEYFPAIPGTSAQKKRQGKPAGHYKKKVAA